MNDVLSDRHSRGQIICSPASTTSIGCPLQEQMYVFIKIRSRTGACFSLEEAPKYTHRMEHHAPVRVVEMKLVFYRRTLLLRRIKKRPHVFTCSLFLLILLHAASVALRRSLTGSRNILCALEPFSHLLKRCAINLSTRIPLVEDV